MAVSKETTHNDYPLPVYNYRVEIGSEAVAFTEVSGLNIGYEVSVYAESPTTASPPGPRKIYMPAQATQTTITLKKGVVRRSSIKYLYDWIRTVQMNQVEKKDIFVRLCDENGATVITWKVSNAFPTKLDAPTFDAKSNDAAIQSMELVADGVTLEES